MDQYLEALMKIIEDDNATNNQRLKAAELYLKCQILLYMKDERSKWGLEAAASLFGLTVNEDVLEKLRELRRI